MKVVVVLIALLLLVWLLTGSVRRLRQHRPPPAAPPPQVEGMVACAHCGVHLPASLALSSGRQAYCSAAHRAAGPRAPGPPQR